MKIITDGHKYELQNFKEKNQPGQIIQFIEKIPVSEGSTELKTVNDGTTNEEVLEMLINRLNYLQTKFPCKENAVAITHIQTGLLWLKERTTNRLDRGVEGKQIK